MITLSKLAKQFEIGLNQTLDNPEIQFKIWADAGEFQKPNREGNVITNYIYGNLTTNASANDATDLIMGVNNLNLEFILPIQAPRTSATQTAEELQKIKDEQYPFIEYITRAINKYFLVSQVLELKDDENEEFTISWLAGSAITGAVDLRSYVGDSILFTVYIEITFVKDGLSSKSVKAYIDNINNLPIPIKAIRHGRSPLLERDVYADDLVSKSIATSTAFSIDIEFPANKDVATKECLKYLFDGAPNVAHFIDIVFGDYQDKLYFMMLNTVQTAIQGISVPGITASFIEIANNSAVSNVPLSYQIGKFTVNSSETTSLTFTPSVSCLAFISSQALKLIEGEAKTITINPSDIYFNDDLGVNEVCLITNMALSVSDSSAPFEIVKEAQNGK